MRECDLLYPGMDFPSTDVLPRQGHRGGTPTSPGAPDRRRRVPVSFVHGPTAVPLPAHGTAHPHTDPAAPAVPPEITAERTGGIALSRSEPRDVPRP